MTKEEHIKYWLEISDDNFKSMLNMFNSKEYMWSLFVGHLVLEKLLKALYVKVKDKKCTKDFAEKNIERIKELRNWLKEKIGKPSTA